MRRALPIATLVLASCSAAHPPPSPSFDATVAAAPDASTAPAAAGAAPAGYRAYYWPNGDPLWGDRADTVEVFLADYAKDRCLTVFLERSRPGFDCLGPPSSDPTMWLTFPSISTPEGWLVCVGALAGGAATCDSQGFWKGSSAGLPPGGYAAFTGTGSVRFDPRLGPDLQCSLDIHVAFAGYSGTPSWTLDADHVLIRGVGCP
jgi:hypothetical protein